MIRKEKFRHFYLNKYIVKPLSRHRYYLSYDYTHKALWFRVYKVSTRTINHHLKTDCKKGQYIYSSETGYLPAMFKNYFKFAFVREPETRFISAWKDKVLRSNYFHFEPGEHERMKKLENFVGWVKQFDIDHCDEHLRSQHSLIDLNNIDFLGRFEHFEEDFRSVAERIGLPDTDFVHKNKTEEKLFDGEITEKVRKEIIEVYRKDYQLFYADKL